MRSKKRLEHLWVYLYKLFQKKLMFNISI